MRAATSTGAPATLALSRADKLTGSESPLPSPHTMAIQPSLNASSSLPGQFPSLHILPGNNPHNRTVSAPTLRGLFPLPPKLCSFGFSTKERPSPFELLYLVHQKLMYPLHLNSEIPEQQNYIQHSLYTAFSSALSRTCGSGPPPLSSGRPQACAARPPAGTAPGCRSAAGRSRREGARATACAAPSGGGSWGGGGGLRW